MDPELRATLERFERYFELIQQQLGITDGRITSLEDRITSLEDRMTAVEGRLTGIESEIQTLRTEMNERFISADEQFHTLALHLRQFDARTRSDLDTVKKQVSDVNLRLEAVDTGVLQLNGRLDTLGDDMRQRFRLVNDRLGSIEKRDAA